MVSPSFLFFVIAGALLTGGVLFLMVPFLRRSGRKMSAHPARIEEVVDLEIEKESLLTSLAEMEVDYAKKTLSPQDYPQLKLSSEQRLIAVMDALGSFVPKEADLSMAPPHRPFRAHRWAVFVLAGWIVAGTSGVYALVYWKLGVADQDLEAARPPINPLEMVARLEKRLQENPNDLQGQLMAGRSYMALERWDDAKKAWRKALEMDKENEVAHVSLGETLIRSSTPPDQTVFEEALSHFDQALRSTPQEPNALWGKGVALVYLRRFSEADMAWTAALQNIPPGTEAAESVKGALQSLRTGGQSPVSEQSPAS